MENKTGHTVSPEAACKALLEERGLSLATAESCTGGLLAQRLTALPGVSGVYRGGVVSYWTSVKAEVLGVPQAILDADGAVSEATARAMAEGVCRITGAEVGLSVTGVAGPDSDERGNPVGLVFVGLHTPEGTLCRRLALGRQAREQIRRASADTALDMLGGYLGGTSLANQLEL